MDTIFEQADDQVLHFALVPPIPCTKYHTGPLRFLSQPLISQTQYDQKVMSREYIAEDETIFLVAPNNIDGEGFGFLEQRSVLERSPTFAAFFASNFYRPGCSIQITLLTDLAACFHIAFGYLAGDPASVLPHRIMDLLRRAYVGSERLIVLVRLHLLATRLELPELADIAYAALVEWEGQVRAKDCVAFAPFIFDQYPGQSGTEALKDWYVALMKRHRKKLRSLPSWERALEASHSSLAVSWAKWMGSLGAKRTLNTPGREGNTRNLGGTLLNSTISTTSVSATTNASKESLLSRLLSEESSLEKEQFERKRKGKQLQSPKNHDYIDRYDSEADDEISEEESRPDVHSSGDELALATPYCAIESRKAREILGIKPSDLGGGAGSVENESSSATGGASRKASLHSVAGGHRKVSK